MVRQGLQSSNLRVLVAESCDNGFANMSKGLVPLERMTFAAKRSTKFKEWLSPSQVALSSLSNCVVYNVSRAKPKTDFTFWASASHTVETYLQVHGQSPVGLSTMLLLAVSKRTHEIPCKLTPRLCMTCIGLPQRKISGSKESLS